MAGSDEPLGSARDEAAKLFEALQGWARDEAPGGTGAGPLSGLGAVLEQVQHHLGTGEACTLCPLCRLVNRVRDVDPEVRVHLAGAASSLLHAAAAFLDPPGSPGRAREEPGAAAPDADTEEPPTG